MSRQARRFFGEGEIIPRPLLPAPAPPAVNFIMCPMPFQPHPGLPGGWAHEVYRLAYERAEAALRPSWFERCLLESSN